MQLITSLSDTVAIVAVDHEDEALRVLEIMPPQWADLQGRPRGHPSAGAMSKQGLKMWFDAATRPHLVLTTDVPHREADVLVLDRLHIEAYASDDQSHTRRPVGTPGLSNHWPVRSGR